MVKWIILANHDVIVPTTWNLTEDRCGWVKLTRVRYHWLVSASSRRLNSACQAYRNILGTNILECIWWWTEIDSYANHSILNAQGSVNVLRHLPLSSSHTNIHKRTELRMYSVYLIIAHIATNDEGMIVLEVNDPKPLGQTEYNNNELNLLSTSDKSSYPYAG